MEEEGGSEGVGNSGTGSYSEKVQTQVGQYLEGGICVEPYVCNSWQRVITDEREVV